MDKAKIIVQGSPQQLRAKFSHDQLRLVPKSMAPVKAAITSRRLEAQYFKDKIIVTTTDSYQALELIEAVKADLVDFEYVHGTMDDVFLNLTGHKDIT